MLYCLLVLVLNNPKDEQEKGTSFLYPQRDPVVILFEIHL
jgi:hypothetical protein